MATSYQDDFIKTALRLPRDLHARLMESSRESSRSLNAELIARLEQSFAARPAEALARYEAILEGHKALTEELKRALNEVRATKR